MTDGLILIIAVTFTIIWAGATAACFFLGFKAGQLLNKPQPEPAPQIEKPEPPQPTEEEKRLLAKYEQEMSNLFAYNGSPQDK